ncbi:hypothetical protein HC248_00949 [Polaromonas vacuolata]|uniref:Uncharacterized protein n=1 Tax=Polaromonas vacuolata TaxID=37448 RepID=A0A6H2H7C6_9BURK|nr:hypothetical protein HC248_00949 [Polaromonas vacuolata]
MLDVKLSASGMLVISYYDDWDYLLMPKWKVVARYDH